MGVLPARYPSCSIRVKSFWASLSPHTSFKRDSQLNYFVKILFVAPSQGFLTAFFLTRGVLSEDKYGTPKTAILVILNYQ